ncbi:MAG: fasciclin domain-containing protein [Steroidobacteraceae bacterium]|jgi:uncharacterized surface protein with fasciclin (FAS1) repeats
MNQSSNTSASQYGSTNYTPPSRNIIDTAITAGTFTTLLAGIKSAGLTDKLTEKGPFTVFAPTDEAFKKLAPGALEALLKDSAKLKAVLSYHVVAGHMLAKDMKSGDMMTLQGSPLTASVSSSGVHVNGAHVKQADIVATNGVVHVIDAVIMPKNWQLLAAAA